MAKWKESYEKDREKATLNKNSDKFDILRLRVATNGGQPAGEDAKVAKIRFITDSKDAESIWVHTIPKRTRLGKMFHQDYYCLAQDGLECNLCNNINRDISRVKRKLVFWVYVYYILHAKNNEDASWAAVDYYGQTLYKEPINAPKILYQGPGFNNSIETKFLNWDKRFKTLTDRDYEWTREGFTMKDTTYDLIPDAEGKSATPPAVLEAAAKLPSLQEFIESLKPGADALGTVEETNQSIEAQVDKIFA